MTKKAAVDWNRLILDLGRGCTTRILDTLQQHGQWLNRIKNHGAEPKYLDGRQLVLMWMKETGKTEDQLPMMEVKEK